MNQRVADQDQPTLETTEDLFLSGLSCGALRMRQPAHGYRAGLDAIVLAAACPTHAGAMARCLDCGAGVGVAGLALAWRVGDAQVTLIERDPVLAALAVANAATNGIADRVRVVVGDLTGPLTEIADLAERAGTFDHILVNPPFHAHGTGTRAPDRRKDASHAMAAGELGGWARFAAAMARNGGGLTLIHRPAALPEVLAALDRRFGRVRVMPLHPRAGLPASRLLIDAVKGSRAGLQFLPGRVLHRDGGDHTFTPAFDGILRDGVAIDWES